MVDQTKKDDYGGKRAFRRATPSSTAVAAKMRWEFVESIARQGLRLHFEDKGPGIPDLKLALTDGWTSGKGLGVGLSGSKRLVNEFEIRTAVGEGTCVSITRWK